MVLFDSVFASVTQRFPQKMCELPDQAECTNWRNSATHLKKNNLERRLRNFNLTRSLASMQNVTFCIECELSLCSTLIAMILHFRGPASDVAINDLSLVAINQ